MPVSMNSPNVDRVLGHLGDHPGSGAGAIAAALNLGRSTVTKILVGLETEDRAVRTKGRHTGDKVTPDQWYLPGPDHPASPAPPQTGQPDADDGHTIPSTPGTQAAGPDDPPSTPPPVTAEPDAAPAEPPTPASSRGSQQRLRPGELAELVEAFFADNPALEVTAGDVARRLDRSAGAVHNAIQKLITRDLVRFCGDKPRRYTAR